MIKAIRNTILFALITSALLAGYRYGYTEFERIAVAALMLTGLLFILAGLFSDAKSVRNAVDKSSRPAYRYYTLCLSAAMALLLIATAHYIAAVVFSLGVLLISARLSAARKLISTSSRSTSAQD